MSKVIKLLISVARLLVSSIAILIIIPTMITVIWVLSGCYGGLSILRDILSCELVVMTNVLLSGVVIYGLLYHNEI
jgi:hypothetical protein